MDEVEIEFNKIELEHKRLMQERSIILAAAGAIPFGLMNVGLQVSTTQAFNYSVVSIVLGISLLHLGGYVWTGRIRKKAEELDKLKRKLRKNVV